MCAHYCTKKRGVPSGVSLHLLHCGDAASKAQPLLKMLEVTRTSVAELCQNNNRRIICSYMFSFLTRHTVFKLNQKFATAGNVIQVSSVCMLLLTVQLSSGVSVFGNLQLHSKEK